MRILLFPAQVVFFLTILFTADFLQTAALTNCGVCLVPEYGEGYRQFVGALLTGQWGKATFGYLIAPAVQFLEWWLPNSLELAAIALPLSVLLAYPIGLYAGWFPERATDSAARALSVSMLFLPTFLVALLVISVSFETFYHVVGDGPFGLTPSVVWWTFHGGTPAWIGPAGNTEPTGLPLIDGLLHGAWAFEKVTLLKTLLQAGTIALIFTPIFLRYLRSALYELARAPFVTSARSRGVPERVLRWRHGGRQVLPYFLLTLGAALPIYVGTQIVTEFVYGDTGLGSMLLLSITTGRLDGFPTVLVLLFAAVLLISGICTGALARLADPRLLEARS